MIAIRSQKYFALAQVVGDVDVRQPELLLEVEHQLEDLGPDAHVEHGDRLVGDEHLRVQDDRPRDDGALLLTAGQVRGVLREEPLDRGEPDALQGGLDLDAERLAGGDLVDHQRVADRLLDGHRRVERGVRVLEDHLEVGAQPAQLGAAHLGDASLAAVLRVVGDPAVRRRHQPEQRAAERGLAAAGLADQAEHLAALEGDGDAVDGLDAARLQAQHPRQGAALELEVDGEILDVEDRVGPRPGQPVDLRLRRQRRSPPARAVRVRTRVRRPPGRP